MKKLFGWTFALVALALCVSPAHAAKQKMVPEEGAVEVMLLRQLSVQKELNLTEEQVDKIHKFSAHQWEKAQKIADESEESRDKKFKEMHKENEQFIEKHLSESQRKRLHEITLQTTGLLCLSRPHVSSKLDLTAEQKKRLTGMQQEARQQVEEMLQAKSKEEKREKAAELRKTSRKQLLELLTDEQETKWKEMTGKPFEGDLAFFDSGK